MRELLLIVLGGGVGAGLRHLVGVAAIRLMGPGFPWGTLTVNVVGSFVMGVLVALLAKFGPDIAAREIRLFVGVGLLGGFTTFSSFSLDAANLMENGQSHIALAYVLVSVGVGIMALFAGLGLVRWVAP
ncbi:fluoride efflux transporter CrcB [Amorphus orientalis]|uniref:Fluoride-specific ion channel FluC n=1 Tax=Amorphus orientalis TaxID=649198 RepID=A0AAE3VS31_9HYPH|nr:fluoride efflux transporter CrcB [Amorphus orientalis]MDQ0317152.1 CrcB protein [Amorphus orientalis]